MGSRKGVVTCDGNVLRNVAVNSPAVMFNLGGFAVHNFAGISDVAPKNGENALPESDNN